MILCFCTSLFIPSNLVHADVFFLDDNSQISVGDFEFSKHFSSADSLLSSEAGSSISTGLLWQKLDQSGVAKMNQLTLLVDLSSSLAKVDQNLDVDSVELVIRGEHNNELAHFSLRNNSLVIPAVAYGDPNSELQIVANLGLP